VRQATGDYMLSRIQRLPDFHALQCAQVTTLSRRVARSPENYSIPSRHQLVVKFTYAAHHRLSREHLSNSFSSRLAKTSSHSLVGEHGFDRACQCRAIHWRNQHTRRTVNDGFIGTRYFAGDDRLARRDCFEDRQRQSFIKRWKHEEVAGREQLRMSSRCPRKRTRPSSPSLRHSS